MTTFEAISLMDSEGISQLQIAPETLHINFDSETGLSLFYASFDGKLLPQDESTKTLKLVSLYVYRYLPGYGGLESAEV